MATEREGFFVSSQGCITFFVAGTSKFYVLYTMRHNRVNASLQVSSMSVNLEYSLITALAVKRDKSSLELFRSDTENA